MSFVVFRNITTRAGILLWGLGALCAYLGLLEATQGNLLFSDDHPAFLYRFEQLKRNFPFIPFYNPMWNGGVEAREFFPSGILNAYILLSPLMYGFDITGWYNELIAFLFFVVHPACTFFSVRILRLKAPLAPLLALFSSTLWFRYEFQYGTIGFLTSVALTPLFFALTIRVIEDGKNGPWRNIFLLAAIASLIFLWTPAAFIVAPALACLCFPLMRFAVTSRGIALISLLLALNVPWLVVFLQVSNVSTFISEPQSGETTEILYPSLLKLLDDARYVLKGAQPVLLLLTIPSLFVVRNQNRLAFRVFASSIVLLFVAGLLLSPLKPRLELGRFMMVAVYFCSIPVAVLLNLKFQGIWARIVSSASIGSVIIVPAIAFVFTANRTLESYSPYSTELPGLIDALKQYSMGGRVAFSGYTQHQLDGGHITPLPLFTGVPLYASRYQHDRWEHVDFIPTQFRKFHDKGIEDFFNLYNISAIAIHDVEWLPWFSARPELYTKVWTGRIFTIFHRRTWPNSWFIEGSGTLLDQQNSEIRLSLTSSSAVLRYNWLPFLTVDGCTTISAAEVFEEVSFVRLDGCNVQVPITVRAKSALTRINPERS